MTVPAMIQENMEVLGSDGVHVGTVEHIEGSNEVRLTRDDSAAGGQYHFIPLAWVRHVGVKIHLRQPAAEAKEQWTTP
jgi:hypothetical protein